MVRKKTKFEIRNQAGFKSRREQGGLSGLADAFMSIVIGAITLNMVAQSLEKSGLLKKSKAKI